MPDLEQSPDLSVIIPAFDAERTLGAQLAALAAQEASFRWEVLVCDNGSRDGTEQLVRTWQARMSHLRLIDAGARRGPAAARNIGVSQAASPLIAFCDADDRVASGWLQGMYDAIQQGELVAGAVDGERLSPGRGASLSWVVDSIYTKPFFPWFPAVGAGCMAIRKDVFEAVGGFDESLRTNEDTDLSWRVQLAGYRLTHQPRAVLYVRKRVGLRAVARQAFASGRGDQHIRERYADIIAAYEALPTTAPTGSTAPSSGRAAGVARRALGKLRTVRGPNDLADQVWRVAYWLGGRLGSLNRREPRLQPPSRLTTPGTTNVEE